MPYLVQPRREIGGGRIALALPYGPANAAVSLVLGPDVVPVQRQSDAQRHAEVHREGRARVLLDKDRERSRGGEVMRKRGEEETR